MHYYKRNLGDYAKKAGRLSMLQHGAYTLLIDACYDREEFPTLEEAMDWTWASSTAEREAVEFVLSKFFTLEGGRYVQKRIKEELEAYRETAETNARIARERETKRKCGSTDRARTVHESSRVENEAPPNQEPLTNNQEPKEKKEPRKRDPSPPPVIRPESVSESVWVDWLTLRRKKSAPVTQTVLQGAEAEAEKAGMTLDAFLRVWCTRGSQGLQADWLKPHERQASRPEPVEPEWRRRERERNEAFAGPFSARAARERAAMGQKVVAINAEVLDADVKFVG